MARVVHESILIPASDVLELCKRVLMSFDVDDDDAQYVAWHLVETSLRGTDSHGIARLPHYVRRLEAGGILPRPEMRFEARGPALGILDGGHGLGHLVMTRATHEAARLARAAGAGWVAVRNSSHCGALAPFGLRLAEQGFIGIVFTHVDPMVLPHGSRVAFAGTNPICITTPAADGECFCLDTATSVVPWNLIVNARNEGVKIPVGWAVDKDGHDTTEPEAAAALYPFAEHKGSGLGIMIDLLCAMLVGAPFGPNIPRMYGDDMGEHRQLGGLVGAIDVSRFVALADFQSRVADYARCLGALPTAEGFDRVRFPGQPELETKQRRQREGIPIGVETLAELNRLAATVMLPSLRTCNP